MLLCRTEGRTEEKKKERHDMDHQVPQMSQGVCVVDRWIGGPTEEDPKRVTGIKGESVQVQKEESDLTSEQGCQDGCFPPGDRQGKDRTTRRSEGNHTRRTR